MTTSKAKTHTTENKNTNTHIHSICINNFMTGNYYINIIHITFTCRPQYLPHRAPTCHNPEMALYSVYSLLCPKNKCLYKALNHKSLSCMLNPRPLTYFHISFVPLIIHMYLYMYVDGPLGLPNFNTTMMCLNVGT